MRDGLYRVTTNYLCAGFYIENGRVLYIAPILRKRFSYWKTVAVHQNPQSTMTEQEARTELSKLVYSDDFQMLAFSGWYYSASIKNRERPAASVYNRAVELVSGDGNKNDVTQMLSHIQFLLKKREEYHGSGNKFEAYTIGNAKALEHMISRKVDNDLAELE